MSLILQKYRLHLSDKNFLISLGVAVLLFAGSLVGNFYAGTYATRQASNSVTDLILSTIPVFDIDHIFVYSSMIFLAFMFVLCVIEPKRIPFVLKSIALFIFTRSIFITLTHIAPFPSQIVVESALLSKFSFSADLFFSGHTGLPFLMALAFWNHKIIRYIFIAGSLVGATIVLAAHIHYSIDVFSAFFITYTIFHLSEVFFKKDYALFLEK